VSWDWATFIAGMFFGSAIGVAAAIRYANYELDKLRKSSEETFERIRREDKETFARIRAEFDALQVAYAAEVNRLRASLGRPTEKS